MIEKILNSIKLRPGVDCNSDEMLLDVINDAIEEVKEYINSGDNDVLSPFCISIVKELVLVKLNRIGAEGLSSQSNSGTSESYTDGIPSDIKSKLRRLRKLR